MQIASHRNQAAKQAVNKAGTLGHKSQHHMKQETTCHRERRNADENKRNRSWRERGQPQKGKAKVTGGTSSPVRQQAKESLHTRDEDLSEMAQQLRKHTFREYFDALMGLPFVPTKFVDQAMLRNMEIYDNVENIFKSMGLGFLPLMAQPGFQELTCEFLASLTLHLKEPNKTTTDIGYIQFMVHRTPYHMALNELSSLFELQQETESLLDNQGFTNPESVWGSISNKPYLAGVCKSSTIRHPAIRYAHKFLAHTIFSQGSSYSQRKGDDPAD